ncbi:hypothetical protein M427DRAFT_35890 [Gonapodya prolifera JEL478]|uniref:Bromodomain associated domain-containing protein n=1 Tax=Gonapodya prolifera (strain JEL478) TaxID=1344416 RepID=A0A139A3J5_GONPJ|nr:hypothetical protein M427DRAFT_35890 [Gonapodya prolifera JEL478]|eukprot:KXS11350.1 hypothetical protein M427DRAFT_35890 [Gonapodya prolifera JEL478]
MTTAAAAAQLSSMGFAAALTPAPGQAELNQQQQLQQATAQLAQLLALTKNGVSSAQTRSIINRHLLNSAYANPKDPFSALGVPLHLARSDGPRPFAHSIARVFVSQVLAQAGFERTSLAAIDALADIGLQFLSLVGRRARNWAEHSGRSRCNLTDAAKALDEVGVAAEDLAAFARDWLALEPNNPNLRTPVVVAAFPTDVRLDPSDEHGSSSESDDESSAEQGSKSASKSGRVSLLLNSQRPSGSSAGTQRRQIQAPQPRRGPVRGGFVRLEPGPFPMGLPDILPIPSLATPPPNPSTAPTGTPHPHQFPAGAGPPQATFPSPVVAIPTSATTASPAQPHPDASVAPPPESTNPVVDQLLPSIDLSLPNPTRRRPHAGPGAHREATPGSTLEASAPAAQSTPSSPPRDQTRSPSVARSMTPARSPSPTPSASAPLIQNPSTDPPRPPTPTYPSSYAVRFSAPLVAPRSRTGHGHFRAEEEEGRPDAHEHVVGWEESRTGKSGLGAWMRGWGGIGVGLDVDGEGEAEGEKGRGGDLEEEVGEEGGEKEKEKAKESGDGDGDEDMGLRGEDGNVEGNSQNGSAGESNLKDGIAREEGGRSPGDEGDQRTRTNSRDMMVDRKEQAALTVEGVGNQGADRHVDIDMVLDNGPRDDDSARVAKGKENGFDGTMPTEKEERIDANQLEKEAAAMNLSLSNGVNGVEAVPLTNSHVYGDGGKEADLDDDNLDIDVDIVSIEPHSDAAVPAPVQLVSDAAPHLVRETTPAPAPAPPSIPLPPRPRPQPPDPTALLKKALESVRKAGLGGPLTMMVDPPEINVEPPAPQNPAAVPAPPPTLVSASVATTSEAPPAPASASGESLPSSQPQPAAPGLKLKLKLTVPKPAVTAPPAAPAPPPPPPPFRPPRVLLPLLSSHMSLLHPPSAADRLFAYSRGALLDTAFDLAMASSPPSDTSMSRLFRTAKRGGKHIVPQPEEGIDVNVGVFGGISGGTQAFDYGPWLKVVQPKRRGGRGRGGGSVAFPMSSGPGLGRGGPAGPSKVLVGPKMHGHNIKKSGRNQVLNHHHPLHGAGGRGAARAVSPTTVVPALWPPVQNQGGPISLSAAVGGEAEVETFGELDPPRTPQYSPPGPDTPAAAAPKFKVKFSGVGIGAGTPPTASFQSLGRPMSLSESLKGGGSDPAGWPKVPSMAGMSSPTPGAVSGGAGSGGTRIKLSFRPKGAAPAGPETPATPLQPVSISSQGVSNGSIGGSGSGSTPYSPGWIGDGIVQSPMVEDFGDGWGSGGGQRSGGSSPGMGMRMGMGLDHGTANGGGGGVGDAIEYSEDEDEDEGGDEGEGEEGDEDEEDEDDMLVDVE